ncbi:Helix-turn-helix domain protein [Botrimarina colliarenosi]|uniref:Helix-turn-helix domain protein n=1 Tax=Botrimarina colliarenosi TaxID=2528001 RepID=A0A5C6AA63_9BACT|nr:helix-turn-helix domain-containing protein [Botrimarina colliarenosi]TWT96912.1 Helix-turn-helix domain protein [Botrimarina colliarenosi]
MERIDEYLKLAEAAKTLGVAENTLRSWADSGKVAVTRNPANGYRLFRREDLEQFLDSVRNEREMRKPR